MKIEKIKKLKSGKYKIELDNHDKLLTYDDVILNNNLLFNSNVTNEMLNKLNIETKYYDIYNKCVRFISTKMRSKVEMENYLNNLQVIEEDKEKIIQNLINIGLIDDNKFMKAFISDKIHLSNIGPNRIKEELLKHQINSDKIEEELYTYDNSIFEEKIQSYIEKKEKNMKCSNYIFGQKMITELINLGYEKDDILKCLNNLTFDDSNLLEQEAEKIILKLSKKYSGEELKKKCKNKLYQKGYSIDSINNYIEKRIV